MSERGDQERRGQAQVMEKRGRKQENDGHEKSHTEIRKSAERKGREHPKQIETRDREMETVGEQENIQTPTEMAGER